MIRMHTTKRIGAWAAALALVTGTGAIPFGNATVHAADDFQLRILHSNDTHAHLDNIARRVTAINDAKNDHTLLLDAGDVFSGTLYFNQYKGLADLYFMNELGYDAMTFGNHEFDQKPVTLAEFVKQAKFPIVSSNIDLTKDADLGSLYVNEVGEPAEAGKIYPAIIVEVAGEKIGLFGLTTPDTVSLSSPGENVIFKDPAESARSAIAMLESKGVNKIIVLDHLGFEVDQELAEEVEGIDIIVGGHSHTKLDAPVVAHEDGEPTLIVQTGEYAQNLGQLDATFDENGVLTDWEGKLTAIDAMDEAGNYLIAENPEAAAKLAEFAGPLEELRQKVVGKSLVTLDGERTTARSQETNLGDLIADGMLAKVKSIVKEPDVKGYVAITNGGGIRASIPSGDMTLGDLLTTMPFGNNLSALKMTGKEIISALEGGVGAIEDGEGRFPQVAGLKFAFDSTKPGRKIDSVSGEMTQEGQRIVNVQVEAEDGTYADIDPNASYIVATNSFMADGGDFYFAMKEAKDDGRYYELNLVDYEIFLEYLNQLGTVDQNVEGRITDLKGASLPEDGAGDAPAFADIAGDDNEAAINEAAAEGIVNGYEDALFHPDRAVTRAEFAAMLGRMLGMTGSGGEIAFADADSIPAWAAPAVSQLADLQAWPGMADNRFMPAQPVTQGEAAAVLAIATGQNPVDAEAPDAAITRGELVSWIVSAAKSLQH